MSRPSTKKIKNRPLKSGVHLQWKLEVDAFKSARKGNSEGYPDPTAGEALSRIAANEKQSLRAFRPIAYICSPFSGDVETNVANARRYSRFAVDKGYIPIAPHLLFPQFIDDDNPDERELGLFFGNALMSKCAEVWVFGSRI